MSMSRWEKFLWFAATAGFAVGAFGLYDRLVWEHLHVDYGTAVPWGLWVAAYAYLIGISAGAFLLSTLVYAFGVKRLEPIGKLALFTAVCALGVAMFSIVLDLGRPERSLELFTRTNFHSVMGWMIWLYSAYFVLLVAELWVALRADFVAWSERRGISGTLARVLTAGRRDVSPEALERDRGILRVLAALGIPLATAFHGGVGALFGAAIARPYWNTGLTPIIFLIGALLSGGALLTFVAMVFGPAPGSQEHTETVVFLGRIVLGLLLFDALLEWAEYSIGLYGGIPAEVDALRVFLFGSYAWVFWGVHVALGVAVPALILTVRGKSPVWVGLAGLLIAVTFFSVRLNIVIPALVTPELHDEALQGVFIRPAVTYFPTLTEWLTQLWICATGALAFLIGYHVLPVVPGERP